ncbi:MAG: SDR family NAD(P)-dependent oxidoreductase [Pseudomonadota bacterium]
MNDQFLPIDKLVALSPEKLALYAIGLQRRLDRAAREKHAPIAVVGASGRFPGGAEGVEGLWSLLDEGRDAIGPVPPSRWDADAFFRPHPAPPGYTSVREGGFLDGIDLFDPAFFGISPREAAAMDPQQRLTLEMAWRAFEDAGMAPDRLSGSAAGVFVGAGAQDYSRRIAGPGGDLAQMDAHFGAGNGNSVIAGRVAYQLGLRGPAVTVDTACSSSLVALHLACQALRLGEIDLAVGGGVNVILEPAGHVALSQTGMLAPDARCKAFDASANGFVRSEGVGFVILKRLDDALADGDRVLAVIRGTALNQDGRSSSLTAPNGPSQEAVIRAALADAGVDASEVRLLETHGTGTELGDPIEAGAAAAAYAKRRDEDDPLLLGALKSAIGHMETAAGVGGLLKLVGVFRHGRIPANLHLRERSPLIPWERIAVRPVDAVVPWTGRHRLAGLSSFGYSGTNAHMIVAAPPEPAPVITSPRARPIVLSANSRDALERLVGATRTALRTAEPDAFARSVHSLGRGRALLPARIAVSASDGAEAAELLDEAAQNEPTVAHSLDEPAIAFLFTGQGAQSPAMAWGLMAESAAFRQVIERLDPVVRDRPEWAFDETPLIALLTRTKDVPDITRTVYAQPALYAFEVAMAALWEARGIRPAAVIGHSLGEIAAAAVAGVMNVETGFRLALERGRSMEACPGGAMASVEGSRSAVEETIASLGPRTPPVSIAGVNGPSSVTVAGTEDAVADFMTALAGRGIRSRRLTVSHAFHSAAMEPAMVPLDAFVGTLAFRAPSVPIVSNLTGGWAGDETFADPAYWSRHLRAPVDFMAGASALLADAPGVVLEVGPRPQLLPLVGAIAAADGRAPRLVASCRDDRPSDRSLAEAAAALALDGARLDWRGLAADQGETLPLVDVPPAPMDPVRCWLDTDSDWWGLIGRRVETAMPVTIFENRLSAREPAWLGDHRVADRVLMPASCFIQMMLEAASTVNGGIDQVFEDIAFTAPLDLTDGTAATVQTTVERTGLAHRIRIHARQGTDGFVERASATLGREGVIPALPPTPPGRCRPVDIDALKARRTSFGLDLGPAFDGLVSLERGDDVAIASIALPPGAGAPPATGIHPVLLDAALQALGALVEDAVSGRGALVPSNIGRIAFHRAPGRSACVTAWWSERPDGETPEACIDVTDADGQAILTIEGLRFAHLHGEPSLPEGWFWRVDWQEVAPAERPPMRLAAVADALADTLGALDRDPEIAAHKAFLDRLEALGPAIARAAIASVTRDDVPSHRRRLYARIAEIAEGAEASDAGIEPIAALDALRTDDDVRRAEIDMVARCAEGLPDVLHGGDPLALLFPDGALGHAEAVYTEGPLARALARLAGASIAALMPGRARILEIGAGTGSLTRAVLDALAEPPVRYAYTDVSSHFLEHGRALFADRPGMEYARFDVEGPPGPQGFEPGDFDLVLASNVLHATRDLDESLRHARELLAPGGVLVLVEATERRLAADLTFGLTDGWWRFQDTARRPDHPLLDRAGWFEGLSDAGFEEIASLPGDGSEAIAEHAVLLARKPQRDAADDLVGPVILRGRGPIADALAQRLRAVGTTVIPVPASAEGSQAVEAGPPPSHVIDLSALSATGSDDSRAADMGADLADLVRAVEAGTRARPDRLLVVTAEGATIGAGTPDPGQAALAGVVRVLAREHPHLGAGLLDLPADLAPRDAAAAILRTLAMPCRTELALRAGRLLVPSLAPDRVARLAGAPWRVAIGERGSLGALAPQPLERRQPGPGEVEIAVHAAALNFRDVLNTMGLYPGELGDPGEECAGIVIAVGSGVDGLAPGDAVVAAVGQSMATHVTAPAELVRPLPPGLGMAEGASLPVAYLTAAVALRHLARLGAGERVLVHAAAGGVGMAAAHIAHAAGAQVFATAHPSKWPVLRAIGVAEDAIASSRSPGFGARVMDWTGGDGADVVLNSLAEPFIGESFAALARGGRFVEIGRRGIWTREQATSRRPDAAYFPLVVAEEVARDRAGVARVFDDVLGDVAYGTLPPIAHTVHPAARFDEAFDAMARGAHTGKLVLDFAAAHREGRSGIRADGSYLVTGGLRGIGPLVGRWLAEQRAGRIVLLARHAPDAAAEEAISAMREAGAEVEVMLLDLTDTPALESAWPRIAGDERPLRGIFHGAGVLDDGPLITLDRARFATVLGPKLSAGLVLDRLSRGIGLDHFVLFSAGAALFGSPGQASHAAANAALDALAAARRKAGEAALTVDWGPWSGIGAAADTALQSKIREQGMGPIDPVRGIRALERAIGSGATQLAVLPFEREAFARRYDAKTVPAIAATLWAEWQSRDVDAPPEAEASQGQAAGEPASQPAAARPSDRAALVERLTAEAARALGLARGAEIDPRRALRDIGLDSLISVELRNRLAEGFGLALPATLLFDHPTIDALADEIGPRLFGSAVPARIAAAAKAPEQSTATRDIAIVGIGCRFPGAVAGREAFWEFLMRGGDGVVEVPPDRWDVNAWYDPDPDTPGRTYMRRGGFLDQIDRFDAAFFGISPAEAATMDPQQRLLLETAWEALEDAGIAADSLSDTPTGVYVGICGSDYANRVLASPGVLGGEDMHFATGNAVSVAAGRLAYVLGLTGPALSVDTACSSSLVSVHLARRALLDGECDLALAGGVGVILEPRVAVAFSRNRVMAPDGRTKAFAEGADGMVRGEGCGIVALKRLDDARRAGDPVIAVIRGSAMNQDGRSAGITAPNGPAQEQVIRRALAESGLAPTDVAMVETHGTGTPLGDPIEAQAIAAVLGEGRAPENAVLLGAVKTNLGHLEGAAGIAGLIKAALCVHEGRVPLNLHFEEPSGHIDWQTLPIAVPTAATDWPIGGTPVVGVSSFGFSGTNAHVIVSGSTDHDPSPWDPGNAASDAGFVSGRDGPDVTGAHLVLVSARDRDALVALAERFASKMSGMPSDRFARIAAESQHRRAHLPCRLALAARTPAEAVEALTDWRGGAAPATLRTGRATLGKTPRAGFLFSGQGGQWPAMAVEPMATDAVFRDALHEVSGALARHGALGVADVLASGDRPSGLFEIQTSLFAVQVALCRRLAAWGIEPAAVAGHSMGEVAALLAAGALDLDAAAKVAVGRARALTLIEGKGHMIVVGLPAPALELLIAPYGDACSIGAINSRTSTVVSGTDAALEALSAILLRDGIFHREVEARVPSHSPLTAPMEAPLKAALAGLNAAAPSVPFFSTALGAALDDRAPDAEYWWTNVSRPVLGADAVRWMADGGVTHVIEIGAHPVLLQAVEQESDGRLVPLGCLPRDQAGSASLLAVLGALHADGHAVDWASVSPRPSGKVSLPHYPWRRRRHWVAGDSPPLPPDLAADAVAAVQDDVPWSAMLETRWRPLPVEDPSASDRPAWQVVGGENPVGRALVEALDALGQPATLAVAAAPGARVIDLSGLSASLPDGVAGAAEALGLIALRDSIVARPACLWCVTAGAQAVGARDDLRPSGAALWGARRVALLEAPEIGGGVIDLDPADPPDIQAGQIAASVLSRDGEDQVAWRKGRRFAPRLAQMPRRAAALPTLPPDATCILTGGLGGVGLQVASWLSRLGARRLILCGRTLPDPAADSAIEAMRAGGTEVIAERMDVTDRAAIDAVFARHGPPDAVFHAAGVTEPCRIADLDPARMDRVLAAKVAGTAALEAACDAAGDGRAPGWFVTFSSGAALWGSEAQMHYAAANAAMDAMMARRRARGAHGLSVAWGWWGESGMVDDAAAAYFRAMGLEPVAPEACLAALGHLLATDRTAAAVSDMAWRHFRDVQEARRRRPLLEEMGGGGERAPADGPGTLCAALDGLDPNARLARLTDEIAQMAATVLGFADGGQIDPDAGFFQLGMDSIMAVKLRGMIEKATGRTFPPSIAFEYPSVSALAAMLAGEIGTAEADPAGEPTTQDASDDLVDMVADLDEATLDRLLAGAGDDR